MNFIKAAISLSFTIFSLSYCSADDYKAKKATVAPLIDGNDNDVCWSTVIWSPINQVWDPQNAAPGTPNDFTGHYKAVWTPDKLYVLMRITDDQLTNWTQGKDPLVDYYKTDCPEIFIDEDHSKGNHLCSYNAFAYHISLSYDVVDNDNSNTGNCKPQLFNDVLTGARIKIGNTYYWEFAINVFSDKYVLGAANNPKATLSEGKIMGFSIAYNDSDDSFNREKMYGSQLIKPDPTYGTNVSYVNADYFGSMELVAADITSLEENESASETIIYPNPASEKIYFKSTEKIRNIQVQDYSGNTVSEIIPNSIDGMIIAKDLKAGVYFVQIETETKKIRKKLIINKTK